MENEKKNNPAPEDRHLLDETQVVPISEQASEKGAPSPSGLSEEDARMLNDIISENWDATQVIPDPDTSADTVHPSSEAEIPPEINLSDEQSAPDLSLEDTYLPEGLEDLSALQDVRKTEPLQEPGKPKAPEKKGRPGLKKGYGLLGIPHILATLIWLAIILAIGVSLGRTIWVCTADLMAFGKGSQEVTVTITGSDTIETVSQKLKDANLIRYPGLFKMFAEVTGKDAHISTGTFKLNTHFDYNAMINAMGSYAPSREEVDVMFPEGYNCAQIFRLLEEKNVCTVAELEAWAASGELDDYWFLEGVPRGDRYCLEGYLAPDTYTFYTHDDPQRVLEKFLDEFDDRFTDIMREDLAALQEKYAKRLSSNGYGSEYIEQHPLTLHKVVTLASMVEKEIADDGETFNIASVYFNRLVNPGSYPLLDCDATVYYALGDYFGEKDSLTQEDLNFDSPYNTRKSQGLPPGPIANPGVYSMYAALDPEETNFYYYVFSPKDRKHIFSTSYREHQRVLEKLGY